MLRLEHVSKIYPTGEVLRDVTWEIKPGDRIGLVGVNGAGKSTQMRLIAGHEEPTSGSVVRQGEPRIAFLQQEFDVDPNRSVRQELFQAFGEAATVLNRQREVEEAMGSDHAAEDPDHLDQLIHELGQLQNRFEALHGYELDARIDKLLPTIGFTPDSAECQVGDYSGGWQMRIALGKILLQEPDLLLLDEPTNHLDVESIIWLEEWLSSEFKGAFVLTSHDRAFMNRIVKTIVEISDQAVTTYGGNYDFYLQEREIRRENLKASYQKQQDQLAKDEAFIARFKARVSHAAQVQSRIKKLEKIERIVLPREPHKIRFSFEPAPRSGDEVVKFEGLSKIWPNPEGGETLVFQGVDGMIRRGEKVAVVGVNGAGKSTFLKVIAGQTEATAGDVVMGANVHVGYFSQHSMELLDPERTIYETLREVMPTASNGTVRKLLASFLFSGDDVDKKVSILSGGEKSRVVLASILARPLNLLILDEPTNHLDIQSREVLLDALNGFDGTVMIVSHDRHFLRALANRVIAIAKHEVINYAGDYEYYLYKSEQSS